MRELVVSSLWIAFLLLPGFCFFLIRVYPRASAAAFNLERAVRLELTNTGSAIRRLSCLAPRAGRTDIPDCTVCLEEGQAGMPVLRLYHQ
jgi:hypothetical protein